MPNRKQLLIHNIYIPPRSSCSAGHNSSIAHLLGNSEMSLIVGDNNARHFWWHVNTNRDERGEQPADEIDIADCTILSENEVKRLLANDRSTSPDICMAPNDIALLSDCSVSTSLARNNLPIIIIINSELFTSDGPRRTFINFKKADWARIAEACWKYLAGAGKATTVDQAEKTFRKAVNKASCLFIPTGRIQHFQSTLPH